MVILGSQGVGKTSFLDSYQQKKFQVKVRPSDAAHYVTVMIDLAGCTDQVQMQIWDLPGKSSFVPLNRMYIRDANVALIMYDVNDASSLSLQDGQTLANRHLISLFLETSAKTKENIDRLFTKIAQECH